MTTYMLDAIENGGMEFIRSLGPQWKPLSVLLQRMSLNQRRSFCCKILYQRMKEMKLEELAKSAIEPRPFIRETPALTPEERQKAQQDADWEQALPQNVRDAYLAPKKLNAPYNITVAQLQIRGHYLPPVDFMADFCLRAAYHFGLPATGPVPLPRRVQRWTVIKSPFIFKKKQENFERRTYARLVTVKDGHPDVVEMWLSYCVRNMFHGTGMKVNMFTNDYVGVGKSMDGDIKRLIEQERWAVDGYNHLHDDAKQLQNTIDMEIKRIESQMAKRDDTERARRVLQHRVTQLLSLEGLAEQEAQEIVLKEASKFSSSKTDEDVSPEVIEEKREMKFRELRREAMQSRAQKLPALDVEELEKEVEWDKQQDEALRKHLVHVGKYAQQKGIAPLTREEYFTYVPFVLLPKYKGIHKDIFDKVDELDLLRIPKGNAGYLSDWDNLTERERYALIVRHRRKAEHATVQSDKIDTSRLERMLQRRRNRRISTFDAGFEEALENTSARNSTPTQPVQPVNVPPESGSEAMAQLDQPRSDQIEVDEQAASTDRVAPESINAGVASGVEEIPQAQSGEVASTTAEEAPAENIQHTEVEEVEVDMASTATQEEVFDLPAEETQQVKAEGVKDDVVADGEAGATKTELVDETEVQGESEHSTNEIPTEDNSTPKP